MMKHLLIVLFCTLFAVQGFSQSVDELKSQAKKALDAKKYEKAESLYTKVINKGETSGNIYWNRGVCYYNLDKLQLAINDYLRAIPLYSDNPESQSKLNKYIADNYKTLKEYNQSIVYYNKAIALNKDNRFDCYWSRGICFAVQEEYAQAIESYKEALLGFTDKPVDKSSLYKNIAVNYKSLKEAEKSVEFYDKAIALNTDNKYSCCWNKGVSLASLYKYEEAIESYKEALLGYSDKPKDQGALYKNIGVNYSRLGEHEVAIDYFDKSIAVSSEYKYYCFWKKGNSLGNLKRYKEAIESYEKAMPGYVDGSVNMGKLYKLIAANYFDISDYDQAVIYYSKAIEKNKENVNYYYFRGKSNYLQDKQAEAKPDFLKVIEMTKEKPSIFTAFSQMFLGDKEGAVYTLKKLKPNFEKYNNLDDYYYNLACVHGLMADELNTIKSLDNAFTAGYDYKTRGINSTDFEFVKYKKSFKDLLAKHNFSYDYEKPSIEFLITNEVKAELLKWMVKGEFETNAAYQVRMKQTETKVKELQDASMQAMMKEQLAEIDFTKFHLGRYDTESESFMLDFEEIKSIVLHVPIAEAPLFKKSIVKLRFLKPKLTVSNDEWVVSDMKVSNPVNGKSYTYSITQQANYNSANLFALNYGDLDINIDKNISSNLTGQKQSISVISANKQSDIDVNIPKLEAVNENAFALIIGNEFYQNEIQVSYAHRDANSFNLYAKNILGVPDNHIHFAKDATYGQLLSEMEWISNVIKAYNGKARVYVYYAGHGMPDEKSKSAFLLPTDGNSTISRTAIKLDEFYANLSEYPSESVTVFLDACFSGAARDGNLAKGRGVKVVPKKNVLKGSLVVFSATSGNETAFPYSDQQHGLFTYYLLKKLKETKGDINYQELKQYLTDKVYKESIIINNKPQTPTVIRSYELGEEWKRKSLK